jgi:hypothetical protein
MGATGSLPRTASRIIHTGQNLGRFGWERLYTDDPDPPTCERGSYLSVLAIVKIFSP